MNTKALRQKVLDLAIHGKLVPQNPNDESATVLLEKIRAEKAEKIKKGELKADKKDSFIFVGSDKRHYEQFADGTVKDIEDEIPFEVPDGWGWCKLNELADIARGGSPRPIENYITDSPDGINWIKIGDTAPESKYIESAKEKIKPEGQKHSRFVHEGDFLLTNSMSFGRPYILKINGCIHDGWLVFANIKECVIKDYLYYALSSDYIYASFSMVAAGSTVKNLKSDTVKQVLFPLPPIKTQEKIVESIEKSFTQIDILDNEKLDLQAAIKQAKSKILDLAIHGKLVPQDLNDEPAEELLKRIATSDNRPYKKIDEDEALFDITESWSWCTLGEIYTHTTGKALKKTNNKGTLRKYITTSNLYWNSFDFTEVREMYFTDDELEKCTIKKGDLILCNGGDVGRAAIWNYDYDICYQNHVSRLRPKNKNINNSFFLYVIMIYKQQGILNGKGVGIISLSASDLLSAVVPLPPYSEQNRIVEKIECLYGNLTIINNQL